MIARQASGTEGVGESRREEESETRQTRVERRGPDGAVVTLVARDASLSFSAVFRLCKRNFRLDKLRSPPAPYSAPRI